MSVKQLLFYIAIGVSSTAMAQNRVFISGTVGKYSMKMMKEFQEEIFNAMQEEDEDLEMKIVAEFPASLQIDIGFMHKIGEEGYAGGYLNYAFTKGRLDYSDYSGQTYLDQNIYRVVLGGELLKAYANGVRVFMKTGLNYSMLNIVSYTTVNGAGSAEDVVKFYSYGLSAEPGIGYEYVFNKMGLGLNVGYEINVQGKTFLKEDNNAYLLNSEGDPIRINWSGVRLGLQATYMF